MAVYTYISMYIYSQILIIIIQRIIGAGHWRKGRQIYEKENKIY
jgi:hypothetical protein